RRRSSGDRGPQTSFGQRHGRADGKRRRLRGRFPDAARQDNRRPAGGADQQRGGGDLRRQQHGQRGGRLHGDDRLGRWDELGGYGVRLGRVIQRFGVAHLRDGR